MPDDLERRIVTVLFADLVEFTPLAEELDPEDVSAIQDAYFGVVRDTVGRYGGSLEKFIGDAVMAAFGLGSGRDDDAERAVRAGLAIVNGVDSLGARLGLDADQLRVRVGVNTGEAVVAPSVPAEGQGTDRGRVTGDVVNVAARLQSASTPGRVLVGPATALAVAEGIELDTAVPVELKGKSEPALAQLVVGPRPERSRELAMGGLRAPVLGRATEIARLLQAAARSTSAERERVLVVAEPGVGKTRLLAELALLLAHESRRIVRVRLRPEAAAPFPLVRQLVAAALETDVGAPARTAPERLTERLVAAGAMPGRAAVIAEEMLSVVEPPRAGGRGRPGAERDELFASWRDGLRLLLEDRPTALLVEDLHWARRDDGAFLEVLADDTAWPDLLVVGTTRPSGLGNLDDAWAVLDLAPLEAADARSLVAALVGDAVTESLAERIVERSDGNPLFIEELFRTWVAVGALRAGPDGSWSLTIEPEEVTLPTTIQALYASQLDDLPDGARTVARRASVAGRRFPFGALGALGASAPAAAVDELAQRAIVTGPVPGVIGGDTYAYRHALVRDAGYASLARAERAGLHLRLAEWLEGAAGDHLDDAAAAIGGHLADAVESAPRLGHTIGGRRPRDEVAVEAAAWLERGAERGIALGAYDSARASLRRAIDLTPPGGPLVLGRRLRRLGDTIEGIGDSEEAGEAFRQATEAFEAALSSTTDEQAAHEARHALGTAASAFSRVRFEQTRFAEALAIAERGLAAVGTEDAAARLPLTLASIRARMGIDNDARAVLDEAREVTEIAHALGDPDLVLAAMECELRLRMEVVEVDASELTELGDLLEAAGRWRDAASVLRAATMMVTDDAAFSRSADRVEALADARGLSEQRAWILQTRAERALERGAWDAALTAGTEAAAIGVAHGYERAVVRTWFVLSPIAAARGDGTTVARIATWFAERAGMFPDSPYGRVMHRAVDVDIASLGLAPPPTLDPERLLPGFSLTYTNADWLLARERIAGAWLAEGQADAVRSALAAREGLADDPRGLGGTSRSLVAAWLAETDGDAEAAIAHARAALHTPAADTAPWWALRALRVLQRLGRATPDQERRARDLERELGVAPDVARAR
jgi:class 3 adenylate cyclase/tetratricopeptide (TPR) repeat protein/energy-coupling factor transporter ATP-binding protein EcfA2